MGQAIMLLPRSTCFRVRRCGARQPVRDVRLRHDPPRDIRETGRAGRGVSSRTVSAMRIICLRALGCRLRITTSAASRVFTTSRSREATSNEDIEITRLHERHGKMIASWRPRHLNRCRHATPGRFSCCRGTMRPSFPAEIAEAAAVPGALRCHQGLAHRLRDYRCGIDWPTRAVKILKRGLGPALRGRSLR